MTLASRTTSLIVEPLGIFYRICRRTLDDANGSPYRTPRGDGTLSHGGPFSLRNDGATLAWREFCQLADEIFSRSA